METRGTTKRDGCRRRARTTIEDFVKSYFFFHNLEIPQDFFAHLDVLVYVEATIYQMDEANEEICGRLAAGCEPASVGDVQLPGALELREVLRNHGLLDQRVERELDEGLRYWSAERRLCAAMRPPEPCPLAGSTQPCPFTPEEVHACSMGKSFDYRVLNLLLFKLTKRPYDEALLEFLAADEHLVDINDDLVDYEEDVFANSFNIFRAYVHLYGHMAQLQLVERITEWEGLREALLARLPECIQARVRQREKEAAAEAGEGSDKWTFPAPILDERHYMEVYS